MKLKMRKYMYMAVLLSAVVVGFSSCEVEIIDDYPPYATAPDDYLCGYVWTDIWEEGYHQYEQRFIFYRDGRGVEYFMDNGEEWRYNFYWEWDNRNYRSIRMDYADGTSYLEDIVISRSMLKGYLNNEYVEFVAR